MSADVSRPWGRIAAWVGLGVVLVALPQLLDETWTGHFTEWIPLAIAALGLNLLTGYNGQISVGHGALYGVGAYTTALILNGWHWPFLAAVGGSAVVCFVAGVLIGLPALRIKGLYLALVTLAVATLFPQIIEQASSWTGGSAGLGITTQELNRRGVLVDRGVTFTAPEWSGQADDQWRYYLFLLLAVACFLLVRNVVHSRAGRAIIAIRDNETAAEVSGVNVAAAKVFTFGISAALAGVGGALLALYGARVSSGTFTLAASLNLLVAVVVGGTPSILGPAIGAIFIGMFNDVIRPDLPENIQPVTPLVLAAILIGLMFVAPGGLVGIYRQLAARLRARATRDEPTPPPTPTLSGRTS